MRIGPMVWEDGDWGFFEQLAWAADNGFEAVAFHAWPLAAPRRGIDPETMTPQDWARLKQAVEPFSDVDVHAPFDYFDVSLITPNERAREASIELIEQSLLMASRLKAKTVTVHAGSTHAPLAADERRRLLAESLLQLDEVASALGVRVGLEATEDFEIFEQVSFESVGITVDVGHLSFHDGKAYQPWGSLGGLLRHLGRHIVHVHLHDYDGERDHIPLGAGRLDFAEIIGSLQNIGYDGALCLELAPSPSIKADYATSRDLLHTLLADG